ncbi:hypothetical protein ACTD5D_21200 [Nocardia takedensis]|uniref:hypothetical protein n=1 Tax=Nocardia takedensis TaxID=259390 RepID=UPI003F7732A0
MSEPFPRLHLTRQPHTATLTLSSGTVPGPIDRIRLLSDGMSVSAQAFDPPLEVRDESTSLQLPHNTPRFVEPVVEVFYRPAQLVGGRHTPPTRTSFQLSPTAEADIWVHPAPAPTPEPPNTGKGEDPVSPTRKKVDRYWATLDFGTSRAVGAIRTNRAMHNAAGVLPAAAHTRISAMYGVTFEPKRDAGLTIDFESDGDPERCAELWRLVFNTPPLEHRHLRSTHVYSSDIVIRADRVEFIEGNAEDGKRIRGIKRHLLDLDEVIPDTGLTGIEVYRQIYERFLELVQEKEIAGEQITRLFITYPTKLPPDIRARLKTALADLVDRVELEIDEAVAASGFFLMRRFGVDPVLGAETFKLTARGPSGRSAWADFDRWKDADRWHENLLVVDVGGGTTDCALVKLLLIDQTPGDIEPGRGRFYHLQPEVRSSGGRMHLGGDLLTLEIFHRLKSEYDIPEDDTRFRNAGPKEDTRRTTFDDLWDVAEEVKKAGLGGEEPVDVVVGPAVSEDIGSVHRGRAVFVPIDSEERYFQRRITLRADELAAWVDEPLKRIGALAAGIAAGGLTPDPDTGFREGVDHVLFSGGSLQSAYLRNRIQGELRSQLAAEGLAATFEVAAFDDEYCKTGTALGGMYLNAIADAQFQPEQEAVRRDLNNGISHFRVDTSHLRVNLAANFHVAMEHETVYAEPAFHCGQTLHRDGGGHSYAEAGSYPLGAQFHIHRFDIPYKQVTQQAAADTLWATTNVLSREQATELGRNKVQSYYEIDEREQVTLMLSIGPPGWLLEGEAEDLPHDLPALVRTNENGTTVMNVGLYPNVHDPAAGTFDRDPLIAANTPFRSSGILLPVLTSDLYIREPGGQSYLPLLHLPPWTRWISIDIDGKLRLHDRRPSRPEVATPMELIGAELGRVFSVDLDSTAIYDISKDPFSGTQ